MRKGKEMASSKAHTSRSESTTDSRQSRRRVEMNAMSAGSGSGGRRSKQWLVACVSITCCLSQMVRSGQTGATTASGIAPLGIAFPQNKRPFLVPQLAKQQGGNEQTLLRALDEDEHWQSKRLRLIEPDGEISEEERIRLDHIRDLLEAITGTIPPSRPRSVQRSMILLDTNPSGHQQAALTPRHNRPLTRDAGVPARTQRRHGKPDDMPSEGGPRVNSQDLPRPVKGIVWSKDSSGAQSQRTRATPALSKLSRSRALDEQLNQKFNLVAPGRYTTDHLLIQPEQMSRKSHRSGSEEVAIQPPIHSTIQGGDYETKRVENSRSWNNLRGMWGKRSASNDNNRRPETQLEAEARQVFDSPLVAQTQQQKQQQQLEPDNDVGGGGSPADYVGADERGQRQWQTIMSSGDQSISSM